MSVEVALQKLRRYAMYKWLTEESSQDVWSVSDIVAALRSSGVLPNASSRIVVGWCEASNFPGARDYKGNIGWRIPKEDLITFFAGEDGTKTTRDISNMAG